LAVAAADEPMNWHVEVAFESPSELPKASLDRVEDLVDMLSELHAAVTLAPRRITIAAAIQAETIESAFLEGLRQSSLAISRAGLPDLTVVSARVCSEGEMEAELNSPNLPPLVGVAEIANQLGISRQRVSELSSQHRDFPGPVAKLAAGPVWLERAVRRFVENWARKPGRSPT
jgi:hypothetical protein